VDSIRPAWLESLRPHHTLMFKGIDHKLLELISQVGNNYEHKLDLILKEIKRMSIEMDALTAQVKANSDAVDSAVTLINGIADRITAAGVDPVALSALTTELKAKDEALSTAVVANTPVA